MQSNAISDRLAYNPETGEFFWKPCAHRSRAWNSKMAGKRAGSSFKGYKYVRIDGKKVFLHRAAIEIATGSPPAGVVDHINGDPGDNRIANLRVCSHSDNLCNRGKNANNTSGFKGVHLNKVTGRWVAEIWKSGKKHYLGSAETPEAAHLIYRQAAKRLHGGFANDGLPSVDVAA